MCEGQVRRREYAERQRGRSERQHRKRRGNGGKRLQPLGPSAWNRGETSRNDLETAAYLKCECIRIGKKQSGCRQVNDNLGGSQGWVCAMTHCDRKLSTAMSPSCDSGTAL